jgi:hypothetical protein
VTSPKSPQLVRDIVIFLRSYLVLPREELVVLALWILHTHVFEYVEVTSYIALTSVEERCAKTRVLELVLMLAARPWFEVLPSAAILFRKIGSRSRVHTSPGRRARQQQQDQTRSSRAPWRCAGWSASSGSSRRFPCATTSRS